MRQPVVLLRRHTPESFARTASRKMPYAPLASNRPSGNGKGDAIPSAAE